jgi:hypothetical protein
MSKKEKIGRRSFLKRAALAAAFFGSGVGPAALAMISPQSKRAKFTVDKNAPRPYDYEELQSVPNPDWVTAQYEIVFFTLDRETGEMSPYVSAYPPVRGNRFDFNGRLVMVEPHIVTSKRKT